MNYLNSFSSYTEFHFLNLYLTHIKNTTKYIINNNTDITQHNRLINETDRTIVALLWHENIIDMFGKFNQKDVIAFYVSVLENMCFADFIDRITFQKQIWQFNEMSSLIKTMKNNHVYRNFNVKNFKYSPSEVRFTKVLTKYSTEFNNYQFLCGLTQNLMMEKKDVFSYFNFLKNSDDSNERIEKIIEEMDIVLLDISRMYRILDKFSGDEEL